MDKLGNKLNAIWQELNGGFKATAEVLGKLPKQVSDPVVAAIAKLTGRVDDNTVQLKEAAKQREQLAGRTHKVAGTVNVDNLFEELDRFFNHTTLRTDVDFPELQKIGGTVGIKNVDEVAQAVAQAMPPWPDKLKTEVTNLKQIEVFGQVKVLPAKAGPQDAMPVYLSEDGKAVPLTDLLERIAAVSGHAAGLAAGIPDDMITVDQNGNRSLRTIASFTGATINTASFKDDPTDGTETPKYAKRNPTNHKADVDTTVLNFPADYPSAEIEQELDDANTKLDTLHTDNGAQGSSPPTIPGTGVIGYLRAIYDKVAGGSSTTVVNFPTDYPDAAVEDELDTLNAKDFATQATLAAIKAQTDKLAFDPDSLLRVYRSRRTLTGVYLATFGPNAFTTAADTATAGRLWLVNTSATKKLALREVRFTSDITAAIALSSIPQINAERMTFTGTPSGALVTPALRDTTEAANAGTLRTASTGMTITAGAVFRSFSPPYLDAAAGLLGSISASGQPTEQIYEPKDEDGYIVLRQNEGLVFRQATAGSTTEGRSWWLDLVWEEYT